MFCFEEQLERPCVTWHRRTCCSHLARVCSPGVKCASCSEGASKPLCLWRWWLQGFYRGCCIRSLWGSEESLSRGLALQKFSYSLRLCVLLWFTKVWFFFPCRESQNFPTSMFSSIQEFHNTSPKTINYLVKAGFLFLPENFSCQELEGETKVSGSLSIFLLWVGVWERCF